MTIEKRYQERYRSGDTPWDIGEADFNLIEVITTKPILPCKALDIGCGTGDNSLWLARGRFQVTGTDTSDVALQKAKEKAAQANVLCNFKSVNFIDGRVDGAPFGFAFDRGCFHSFRSDDERKKFARNVADHLEENGLWLTLAGNADERRRGPGPPQLSAGDIVLAVEPFFEILSLTAGHFGSHHSTPPQAWRCLMQKRQAI